MWIDMHSYVVVNDRGLITGIDLEWTFDDGYAQMALDGLDNAAVIVAYRNHVNARQGIQVAFSGHVPVMHAVGAGHDERLFRPLGHLIAHKDVAEEALLRGLGAGDQVGQC